MRLNLMTSTMTLSSARRDAVSSSSSSSSSSFVSLPPLHTASFPPSRPPFAPLVFLLLPSLPACSIFISGVAFPLTCTFSFCHSLELSLISPSSLSLPCITPSHSSHLIHASFCVTSCLFLPEFLFKWTN